MEKYIRVLSQSQLFSQMTDAEIKKALEFTGAKTRSYKNKETILFVGDKIKSLGIIVEGGAVISREDFWGNSSVMAKLAPSQLFGMSYALSSNGLSEVNVIAEKPTKVMYFNIERLFGATEADSAIQSKIIKNLVIELANKNIQFSSKIEHISQRKLRDKILSYLSEISQRTKSSSFTIPFSRQQLADYLCSDRSALSNELCKLRDEGVIEFWKNHFKLYN